MKSEQVYLRHILDAITRINEYLSGMDEATFYQHNLVQDGVIRQLEIMGEAVKNLPDNLRQQYQQVPWKDIAGMRDILIHHYFGVDLEQVWITVQDDLPGLQVEVEKILKVVEGETK